MLHPGRHGANEAVGVQGVPGVAQSSLWFLCAEASPLYCPQNEGGFLQPLCQHSDVLESPDFWRWALGTCWLQLPVVMACKALEQVSSCGTLCPV